MHRLELLFLLLWMRLRAQAQAYPITQDGQSNDIDSSNAGHFAYQNSGDAIEGRHLHTIPKRTPWRHHESEIITTSPPHTDYTPRPAHPHHDSYDTYDSEYDERGGRRPWLKLTSETWSDTEPSPQAEWPTEWPSILDSAETDGPTTPTDPESSPNTHTRWLGILDSAETGDPTTPTDSESETSPNTRTRWLSILDSAKTGDPTTPIDSEYSPDTHTRRPASKPAPIIVTTSARRRPDASSIEWASTIDRSIIYSTPMSDETSEIDATSAISRTLQTTDSPLSPTALFSSSSRSLPQTTRKSTSLAAKTTSSSSSWDIIRPSSSSLFIKASITIFPQVASNDIGPSMSDPSSTPRRDASNSGDVSSGNVPLGVIIGTVFGILFGGLALFCVLFGINKLRQRKQDHESEQRARRLRMGTGMASTSTLMLFRSQEPSGASAAGSIHTNEHGEFDRMGILVRDGEEPPAASGKGGIRFANQRRPSSLPDPSEGDDHAGTPLMQEEGSDPSGAHPPRHHYMERSHSPTVPSPLRTNPVTGRDSPSGWI